MKSGSRFSQKMQGRLSRKGTLYFAGIGFCESNAFDKIVNNNFDEISNGATALKFLRACLKIVYI